MDVPFTQEFVRRMQPALQGRYSVHDALPLEMKLQLERLRLMELIRAERARLVSRSALAAAGAAAKTESASYAMA